MTPADEARFLTLYAQGQTYRQMAAALGCALSTVADRVKALATEGKLTPRPRGGVRQQALTRQAVAPSTTAAPAPHVAPASPAVTFVAVPEIQDMLSLMKDLHARVIALEQTRVPPALTATPATPVPPAAERKEIQQWTVRLSKALIDHLKAVAYERRMPPSQLVEELVWKALTDHQPSTP